MAWPGITKSIWSYILSKLGLFTDINPSQLQLSVSTLTLTDVSVDPTKIDCPDLEISEFVIGRLKLELNSSGVHINAADVSIVASLVSLTPPDLAISMLLESTRENLQQVDPELAPADGPKSSSMASRLADLALSQLSVHVSDVVLRLRLSAEREVSVSIDDAIIPQKNRIEVEVLTANMSATSAHAMEQSVFLDPRGGQLGRSEEIATVNRVVMEYSLDPPSFKAEVDSVRMDGLAMLDLLATCLNEIVFKRQKKASKEANDAKNEAKNEEANGSKKNRGRGSEETREGHREEKLDLSLAIEKIEILETWDSAAPPLVLTRIAADAVQTSIDAVSLAGVLHVVPFLTLRYETFLELVWEVPLSVHVPLEEVGHAVWLLERVQRVLLSLDPPSEPNPDPMNIYLPELRLALGGLVTVHVFPHRVTELGMAVRELIVTAGDGQVLVSDIYLSFVDGLVVDKIKARITPTLVERVEQLAAACRDAYTDDAEFDDAAYSGDDEEAYDFPEAEARPFAGVALPEMSVTLRAIEIESAQYTVRAFANARNEAGKFSAFVSVDGEWAPLSGSLKLAATSTDALRSLTCDTTVSHAALDVAALREVLAARDGKDATTGPKESESALPVIPTVTVNVALDRALVAVEGQSFVVGLGDTKLTVRALDRWQASASAVHVDLEDPTDAGVAPIPLLKASAVRIGAEQRDVHVKIDSAAVGLAADTFSLLAVLGERLSAAAAAENAKAAAAAAAAAAASGEAPAATAGGPALAIPAIGASVNLLDTLEESEFVSSNVAEPAPRLTTFTHQRLDIKDDYMRDLKNRDTAALQHTLLEALGLGGTQFVSALSVDVKQFQCQLFDGFDCVGTQTRMREAIERVARAAKDLRGTKDDGNGEDSEDSEDKDGDDRDGDEQTVVGDFMYQSMLITTRPAAAEALQESVAKDLGSTTDYARSMEPKLVLALRRVRIHTKAHATEARSHLSVAVREAKVLDLVPTSKYKYLLAPEPRAAHDTLVFIQDVVGSAAAPELRVSLAVQPLRLSLDQDTLEFFNRFFQFADDAAGGGAGAGDEFSDVPLTPAAQAFIQRLEFGGLALTIDYKPRKLDYKSLRSGTAAELLNIFAVKGAKLHLQPKVLHGVAGWDGMLAELLAVWMPDIRANQLSGLAAGISPIRRAIKVSKGVSHYTIAPIKRTQISKGAKVVARKTLEELMRLKSSWLESADNALDGGPF